MGDISIKSSLLVAASLVAASVNADDALTNASLPTLTASLPLTTNVLQLHPTVGPVIIKEPKPIQLYQLPNGNFTSNKHYAERQAQKAEHRAVQNMRDYYAAEARARLRYEREVTRPLTKLGLKAAERALDGHKHR